MESSILCRKSRFIICGDTLLHAVDGLLHLVNGLRRNTRHRELRGKRLQHAPQLVDVSDLTGVPIRNEGTFIGLYGDQPGGLQLFEGLPNGRPADKEPVRQLLLNQTLSWLVDTGDDLIPQGLRNLFANFHSFHHASAK